MDLTGNFFWTPTKALRPCCGVTPPSSKRVLPDLTGIAQYLVEPLPLPIRTSRGLAVIGKCGNHGHQILPTFFKVLRTTRLIISKCRADSRPGSSETKQQEPDLWVPTNLF